MSDLLVKLFGYANQQENFLTECFAEGLRHDSALRHGFCRLLLGKPGRCAAAGIATQVAFRGCRSCVDMVVTLADGRTIGIENKLWSAEGKGQLLKYLDLPGVDRVAYITAYEDSPSDAVVGHQKYLRPASGLNHFMWHDFHPMVESSAAQTPASVFTVSLARLFERLGFVKPPDTVPNLWATDQAELRRNRELFSKYWGATRAGLNTRGWQKVGRSDKGAGLTASHGPSTRASAFWFDPALTRGSLRIRVTPTKGTSGEKVRERLERAPLTCKDRIVIAGNSVNRTGGRQPVVDVLISLSSLLEGIRGPTPSRRG
jgi:hypothetical protein